METGNLIRCLVDDLYVGVLDTTEGVDDNTNRALHSDTDERILDSIESSLGFHNNLENDIIFGCEYDNIILSYERV